MGEARVKRELEAAARAGEQATANARGVQLTPVQAFTVMQLELTCHQLIGVAAVLGGNLGEVEASEEVKKTIEHLANFKARYVASKRRQVVIAKPSDVPPLPDGA